MFALSDKFPSISRMVESLSAMSNNLNGVNKEKIFVASAFDEINPFVAVNACPGVEMSFTLMTSTSLIQVLMGQYQKHVHAQL